MTWQEEKYRGRVVLGEARVKVKYKGEPLGEYFNRTIFILDEDRDKNVLPTVEGDTWVTIQVVQYGAVWGEARVKVKYKGQPLTTDFNRTIFYLDEKRGEDMFPLIQAETYVTIRIVK